LFFQILKYASLYLEPMKSCHVQPIKPCHIYILQSSTSTCRGNPHLHHIHLLIPHTLPILIQNSTQHTIYTVMLIPLMLAKPTIPDAALRQAMNYTCGEGVDCKSIQPNGLCHSPDTMVPHTSFAFNSYLQKNKSTSGTYNFGGTVPPVPK